MLQGVDTGGPANRDYAKSLARAFAGAVIFGLPLLMTMEMWWLGFYLGRGRLLQFLLVNFLVLVALSRVSGFERTTRTVDDVMDALAAFGVGAISALLALSLMAVITPDMGMGEIVGKVAIQSVPASFGAMLGSKLLGAAAEAEGQRERRTYVGQLVLMTAGALFLSFNLAPTEEMMLISYRMTAWHSLALIAVSLLALHAFVYTVGFKGEEKPPEPTAFHSTFVRFSVVGYGIALLVSLYVLWTFGRTEGVAAPEIASMVAVLGFPAAIGAAIARLVA